jgi:hypothetical protein
MANPIQNAVGRVTGKPVAVETGTQGLRGVFAKLAEQHREVTTLLSIAVCTSDVAKRRKLWQEIRRELIVHEQAELLEIYPLLEANDATRDIARRHTAHAADVEQLIDEVDAVGVEAEGWQSALEGLIARVEEHIEKEENEFFPRAQQALGNDATRQLERPFLRAKEMAATMFG